MVSSEMVEDYIYLVFKLLGLVINYLNLNLYKLKTKKNIMLI